MVSSKPILIFDGDCRFCRKWISRFRRWTRDCIAAEPWQEATKRFPKIPPANFQEAIHFIQPDGTTSTGAAAAFQALKQGGATRLLWWLYRKIPLFARISEFSYRLVARHRETLSKIEFTLSGPSLEAPSYERSMHWFIQGLGLIYLLAFLSFGLQADGLIGSKGIAPAARLLDLIHSNVGLEAVPRFPTLLWLSSSDDAIHLLWIAGCTAAVAVACGFATGPLLLFLWACYLSLCTASSPFLNFQWDSLLLEAGFIAALLAPWKFRLRPGTHSFPYLGRLLLHWLLFKLMFWSGVVKLSSGDSAWRTLTALDYHFETQPIPNPSAWWLNQLPESLLMAMTAVMFVIELALPFLIFGPRRLKLTAATGFLLLQAAIFVSGNYCFFNLLAMLLCLPLIDDETWKKIASFVPRRRKTPGTKAPAFPPAARIRTPLLAVWLAITILINIPQFFWTFHKQANPPAPLAVLYEALVPFRSINNYGLFAVMTTDRPEITVEGSNDGYNWETYVFKYKPGPLDRLPPQIAPFQPRLDWQMWFAALGEARENPWFMRFVEELLKGSPPVLDLLETNPFPDHPPRYIRASLWNYRFTNSFQKDRTGDWWTREYRGLYLQPVALFQ